MGGDKERPREAEFVPVSTSAVSACASTYVRGEPLQPALDFKPGLAAVARCGIFGRVVLPQGRVAK